MPKDTSRAEVTSNSEKIKPVALAFIELHLSEGISQSVSYSVNIIEIPLNIFKSISSQSESLFEFNFT